MKLKLPLQYSIAQGRCQPNQLTQITTSDTCQSGWPRTLQNAPVCSIFGACLVECGAYSFPPWRDRLPRA